jgi:hypothetical protein
MRQLLPALLLLLVCGTSPAAPRQVDDHRWEGVERIVAIGDLHGDYGSYLAVMQAAGLVDQRGRWTGGQAHLVQTGDIPDRGPDTRRIILHMAKLAKDAARHGGRIHNLMGNHEAMNVYGDLRYVHPGEYAAFADRQSTKRRERYYAAVLDGIARRDPGRPSALPDDFRAQWEAEHPLGWIEHRLAWDPRFDPDGEMYRWTMATRVAIQINDVVFLHGGISSDYCGNSLRSLTTKAHDALRRADPADRGILNDPRGPLWYRGLAGVAPATPLETVDAILANHGAKHVVIGHTPTGGAIWPRLQGRVIMIDTGMSAVYGGLIAYLEITRDGPVAGYRDGRLPLPTDDGGRLAYLDEVIALHPDTASLRQRRDALHAGADSTPVSAEGTAPPTSICDISP